MKKHLIFLITIFFFTCQDSERVWDNPYDSNWDVDQSILILPFDQTINIDEEITLDLNVEGLVATVFAVSMVIDYDSTIIQPINFINGELFEGGGISFFNAVDSKIYLTISSTTNGSFNEGTLCSIKFIGKRIGSSSIQISVDDLYLFDPNLNEYPHGDLYIGSTLITVE